MNNTPDSPAKTPDDRMDQGGNYWTLFTPRIWKVLHAVLESQGPRHAAAVAPTRSCAAETSCRRVRAPLRQTLAVAARRPDADPLSAARPSSTSLAEIVRLRGVPFNRGAGELRAAEFSDSACAMKYMALFTAVLSGTTE